MLKTCTLRNIDDLKELANKKLNKDRIAILTDEKPKSDSSDKDDPKKISADLDVITSILLESEKFKK